MNDNIKQIFIGIAFCILCCVLSLTDTINSFEYLINASFSSTSIRIICLISIIAHPIVVLFYNIIILFYISYLSEYEFKLLTDDFEYYEMIYFREKMQKSSFYVIPLSLYLTILTYFKFFSLYSFKFLLENQKSILIFKNIIQTKSYHSIIIQ